MAAIRMEQKMINMSFSFYSGLKKRVVLLKTET